MIISIYYFKVFNIIVSKIITSCCFLTIKLPSSVLACMRIVFFGWLIKTNKQIFILNFLIIIVHYKL